MKKIFTFAAASLCAVCAMAQSSDAYLIANPEPGEVS